MPQRVAGAYVARGNGVRLLRPRAAASPVIGGHLHAAGYEDFTVDLSDAATAEAAAASARDVTFSDGAVSGAADSALTYRFNAEGDARAARLNIATAGTGNLFARLDCNGHAATKIIGPGNADLSLQADHLHTCRATLSGFAPGLSVVGFDFLRERVPKAGIAPRLQGRHKEAGVERFFVNLDDPAAAYGSAQSTRNVTFDDDAFEGTTESSVAYRFVTLGKASAAALRVTASREGLVSVLLNCNGRVEQKTFGGGNVEVGLRGEGFDVCDATLTWITSKINASRIALDFIDERVPQLADTVWFRVARSTSICIE